MALIFHNQLFGENNVGHPFTPNATDIAQSEVPSGATVIYAKNDSQLYQNAGVAPCPLAECSPIKTVGPDVNYTCLTTDGTIIVTGTVGNQAIYLPGTTARVGQKIVVKNCVPQGGSNPVNIWGDPLGNVLIDAAANYQNYTQYLTNVFQFDGTQWWIID